MPGIQMPPVDKAQAPSLRPCLPAAEAQAEQGGEGQQSDENGQENPAFCQWDAPFLFRLSMGKNCPNYPKKSWIWP